MNRSMDRVRMLRGILLLSNVLIIFLPVMSIWQENYPEQVYSQCSFIQGYLISGTGAGATPASGFTRFMTILLVVLPLVLAVYAGACSLVGRFYGQYAGMAGLAALCLYLCQLFFGMAVLWPERINDAQQYRRGTGTWLLVAVACGLVVLYVIPLFPFLGMKRKRGREQEKIPFPAQAEEPAVRHPVEIPPVHRGAKYSPDNDDSVSYTRTDPVKPGRHSAESHTLTQTQTEIHLPMEQMDTAVGNVSGGVDEMLPPRGVMVGVSGIFAGKEIAFKDGETLRLGRDLANDLVFTNASHISRNHCLITWYARKQKYYVEDRSSNGCFINGALTRLPRNVEIPLEPGTVIDIGDQTNRFRLE